MPLLETGYQRYTFQELLQRQIARAKMLFGEDINTEENTPLGKYIRLNCYDLSEIYEENELLYYSRFPNTAKGASLDRLLPFAGITRNPATAARHTVKIYGESETLVELGFLVSTGDVDFYVVNDYTIGEDGAVVAVVDCTQTGTVGNVQIGSINKIVNPSAKIDRVEHVGLVQLGEEVETDAALRLRFNESVAGIGSATINAIRGAIIRVPLVDGVEVIENDTSETVGDMPPNSFKCFVLSPESQDELVAQAIFSKKPLGIKCVGDVSVNVVDKGGTTHVMRFSRTTEKTLYIKCNIETNAYFAANGIEQIKSNLALYISSFKNGENVNLSSLYGHIYITGVTNVTDLQISTDGETWTTENIEVAPQEVVRLNVDNVEINVEK